LVELKFLKELLDFIIAKEGHEFIERDPYSRQLIHKAFPANFLGIKRWKCAGESNEEKKKRDLELRYIPEAVGMVVEGVTVEGVPVEGVSKNIWKKKKETNQYCVEFFWFLG
jgi:hypothetical protein